MIDMIIKRTIKTKSFLEEDFSEDDLRRVQDELLHNLNIDCMREYKSALSAGDREKIFDKMIKEKEVKK